MLSKLIRFPRIKIYTAPKGFRVKCPRCTRRIGEAEQYIDHSTDGRVHFRCLRVGQTRRFIGKVARVA